MDNRDDKVAQLAQLLDIGRVWGLEPPCAKRLLCMAITTVGANIRDQDPSIALAPHAEAEMRDST